MLSALAKVCTGVLAIRHNDWIEKRGVISECQMVCRKGRTVNNIFILRTITDCRFTESF